MLRTLVPHPQQSTRGEGTAGLLRKGDGAADNRPLAPGLDLASSWGSDAISDRYLFRRRYGALIIGVARPFRNGDRPNSPRALGQEHFNQRLSWRLQTKAGG